MLRLARNCDGNPAITSAIDLLGKDPVTGKARMVLNRCAISFITPATWRAVECYDLWRTYGRFPTDAPLSEQPDELMNIFRLMDNEYRAVRGDEKPLTQIELVEVLNAAVSDKKKRKR